MTLQRRPSRDVWRMLSCWKRIRIDMYELGVRHSHK